MLRHSRSQAQEPGHPGEEIPVWPVLLSAVACWCSFRWLLRSARPPAQAYMSPEINGEQSSGQPVNGPVKSLRLLMSAAVRQVGTPDKCLPHSPRASTCERPPRRPGTDFCSTRVHMWRAMAHCVIRLMASQRSTTPSSSSFRGFSRCCPQRIPLHPEMAQHDGGPMAWCN